MGQPLDSINLLRKVQNSLPDLRKSERKVADFILQHPASILSLRMSDLANKAAVSEPTVIRFCRALGFDGFQSFKSG